MPSHQHQVDADYSQLDLAYHPELGLQSLGSSFSTRVSLTGCVSGRIPSC